MAHYFKMRVCARDAHVCCVGAKGAPLVTSGPRCGCAFVCVSSVISGQLRSESCSLGSRWVGTSRVDAAVVGASALVITILVQTYSIR